jgi:hypothetical protein
MNLKVNLTIGTTTIDITSFIPVSTLEIIKNRTEKEVGDYVASDIDITLIDKDFDFRGKNFKQIFTEFPYNLQDYYPIEVYLDGRLIFSGYLVRETVEFENEYIIKASCISVISCLDTIPLSEIFGNIPNISGNYITILKQIKDYLSGMNISFDFDIGCVNRGTEGRWNWVRQYLFEKTNFRPSEIVPIYFQRDGKTYFGILAINGYLYYLVYKDLDFFLERFTITAHTNEELGTDYNRVVRIFRGKTRNTTNLYYFAVGKFYDNWEQVGIERIYQFKFTNRFEPTGIAIFFDDPNVSLTKPESINIADDYRFYQGKYVDILGKARMTKWAGTENLKYYFDLLEVDGDRLVWCQKCEIDDEPYGVAYYSRWAISGSGRAYIWTYGLTTPLKFDGIDRTIFIGGYYEIGGDVVFIFKNAKLIRLLGLGAWLIISFKENEEVLTAKDHLGLFRRGDEIYVWNFYTNEKFYDYPLPRGTANIPPGTFYEQIGNEIRERPIVIFEDEVNGFNVYNIWLVISKIIPFIHEYELKDTSLRTFLSEIAKSFFCYLCLQGIQQRNFIIRRDIYFNRYCPPQRTIKKEEIIEHPKMIEIRKWDGIEIKSMNETIKKGATGFNKKYFSYPNSKYLTPAWAEWISETFYQLYCSNEFKTYELSVLYDKRNPIGLLFAYNFNLFNKSFRGLVCEVNYRRSDNLLHLIVEELSMIPQQRVPEEQVVIVSELLAVGTSLWELDLDEPDSITLKEEIISGAGLWDYDETNDEVMPALLVEKDTFWELDEENNLVPK